MSNFTVLNRLNTLIDEERLALISGDLECIADLYHEKIAIAPDLAQFELSEHQLTDLRTRLSRNQTLMDHSLSGLRAVSARLGRLQSASRSFDTYDENGQKSSIAPQMSKVEHRV